MKIKMAAAVGEVHVQTKLFTKLRKFNIPDSPFSLPVASGCTELNSLLKGILSEEEKSEHVKFDFLINGEFLRSTIQEYITRSDVSTESVIEIEYILKEDSPKLEQSLIHDDWISGLDISNQFIISGSYDNTVNIWTLNGTCLISLEGHTMAVKSVSWLSTKQDDMKFLSTSQDQTILIWNFNSFDKKSECIHICRGHAGSVDCLAVQPSGEKFASGSWDKIIKIWDVNSTNDGNDEDFEDAVKKNRLSDSERKITNMLPLLSLSGHKEAVSTLCWPHNNELISAGWDHCIRLWDIESSSNKHTLTGNKVILDIAFSVHTQLLASGSTDKHVRLWDTRTREGTVVRTLLSSHNGWVSSVDWSPTDANKLISGSYDNTIKMWDIRNITSPLYNLENHLDKVLCTCWKEQDVILSGGVDCNVHIYKQQPKSPLTSEE
ncbi:ribosome biogenesis protein WDR12 homolog [Hydractinia symbiolongicarpus]|uniref:ribosome biogenesis protein WDR12 homolog n=1 Tax=Hydractinia symbiolongicarpus TaxID=13093 RepID=UPI00254F7621|nr:ribosome biogenesis protein WDR12 homolog [Hydractinia symbiolongicarpus]